MCPVCEWISPGKIVADMPTFSMVLSGGCAQFVNGSHLAPDCAHSVDASHLARQWWTYPLYQWFSPGKIVVGVPILSMVLTWQDSGGCVQFVNGSHWHLVVPILSMPLIWQDNGGCAQFVNASHLAPGCAHSVNASHLARQW